MDHIHTNNGTGPIYMDSRHVDRDPIPIYVDHIHVDHIHANIDHGSRYFDVDW